METEINKVLTQMRLMSGELRTSNAELSQPGPTSFGEVMQQAVRQVNETQQSAATMMNKFEAGNNEVSVAEVMVNMQKASVSFQAMTEVRNKLVEAYREVMSMPV